MDKKNKQKIEKKRITVLDPGIKDKVISYGPCCKMTLGGFPYAE